MTDPVEVNEFHCLAGLEVGFDSVYGEVAEAAAVEHAGLVGQSLDDAQGLASSTPTLSATVLPIT